MTTTTTIHGFQMILQGGGEAGRRQGDFWG